MRRYKYPRHNVYELAEEIQTAKVGQRIAFTRSYLQDIAYNHFDYHNVMEHVMELIIGSRYNWRWYEDYARNTIVFDHFGKE